MKLLFVCSQNKLRSPTAEAVFSVYPGLEVHSAGLNQGAEVPLSTEDLLWAEVIFVMEPVHRRKLRKKFGPWLKEQRLLCLNIPDDYGYMSEDLISLLKQKVLPLIGYGSD